ncbi:trehalose-6-P synthase/phosphatase complex synthase subunit, partial [Penicillium herquei]
ILCIMSISTDLIIVSNRLPITLNKQESGAYKTSSSTGGLSGALEGLGKSMPFRWFGWPGLEVLRDDEDLVIQQLAKHNVHPIFLDTALTDLYYNGFSSQFLSALGELTELQGKHTVNLIKIFADIIISQLHDGDSVWVHDYHLMLLPKFLRQKSQQCKIKINIGFFLHTPFPSSEVYRILPMRKDILDGVLHSDLIGFHTESYARHFTSSCSEVLKTSATLRNVNFHGMPVTVGAFPIGIQPERFAETTERVNVQSQIQELLWRYQGVKLIVSIDCLDYIKGVPQKLHALEAFLNRYPEWVGKLLLMQVAVPTRQDVREYQSLHGEVNELFSPVSFLYRSLDFEEVVALYAASDVCLVSSTRDGMNLVSLEYIASQRLKHGCWYYSNLPVLQRYTDCLMKKQNSHLYNQAEQECKIRGSFGTC